MSDQGYRQLWDDLRAGQRRERAEAATEDAPLFAPHTRARLTDPGTSHEAAASTVQTSAHQRRLVILALEAAGPMTADEIDAYLRWRPTTAGRRLHELRQVGMIRTTGVTKPTRSGRRAEVWELVEARAA
jgi:hypothetical protein